MPVISTSAFATTITSIAGFHNLGGSFTASSDTILYAVWALDINNNKIADYIDPTLKPTQNNMGTRSGMLAQNGGISLRSGEVPDYWNDDFDKAALNDSVYYTGCTYNADHNIQLWETLIYLLNPSYASYSNGIKLHPTIKMDFVIEYGGVLTDNSMIGGKEQKPLNTIKITQDMADRGFTIDSLIDYDPFMFSSIREDGQAILKMYFIDPATSNHPLMTDWSLADLSPLPVGWTKPFKDPETDKLTDTLVIKFNIYNKPVFKSEAISQYVDPHGNIRLDQVSGTPDKYMMRSINGRNWEPATAPLTNMEQLAVGNDVSICLREMDKTIAYQNFQKEFYLSDAFDASQDPTKWGELINKYTTAYNDSIWTYVEIDPLWSSSYGMYYTMFGSNDFAKTTVLGWIDLGILPPLSYAVYTVAAATSYAEDNAAASWPAHAQEKADKVIVPKPCREVINLKFNTITPPEVQRYVEIHTIEGVTANPGAEEKHYVKSYDDFSFTLTFPGGEPLKVTATGFYSQRPEEIKGVELGGGMFRYVIRQIVEPWSVTVSSELASGVNNNVLATGIRVWTFANTLYINSDKTVRTNIYTLSGTLFKQINVPAGMTSVQLERGIYIVEIDGSRYKVVVK
jgi:hypothetical protein